MRRVAVLPSRIPLFLVSVVIFSLAFSGCLISRTAEIRLYLDEDGRSGSGFVYYYDIDSDSDSYEGRESDFEEIIATWTYRSDTDDLSPGLNRELRVEDGKLNGFYMGYFGDIADVFGSNAVIDENGFHYYADPSDRFQTNGIVTHWEGWVEDAKGGTVAIPAEDLEDESKADEYLKITWPAGTREIWYCAHWREGEEMNMSDSPGPSFAEMFEKYLKERTLFDKEMTSIRTHLTQAGVHLMLNEPEEAAKEQQIVCAALENVPTLPDPDPGELLELVDWVRSQDFCPEACEKIEVLAEEIRYKEGSGQ